MQNLPLNDGHTMPAIGFGTYKAENISESVQRAIDDGYRLIDTAAVYGNEYEVGLAVRNAGILRAELFVTSKVWRSDLGYEQTKQAFEQSLNRLGLEYLDLYLIHWPANSRNYQNWAEVNADTWRAMEELQQQGKIRSIGVSNFWPEHLSELFKTANIIPAVNQIEFHPGYWQQEVTEFCKRENIIVQAWSPLARGKLSRNSILKEIAARYDRTVQQVILRWIVQHGVVPLPKSGNPQRIAENIDLFDFELSTEDMKSISEMPQTGFSGERPDLWPNRIS